MLTARIGRTIEGHQTAAADVPQLRQVHRVWLVYPDIECPFVPCVARYSPPPSTRALACDLRGGEATNAVHIEPLPATESVD